MKITSAILSIPPYISTTWKDVSSLHVKADKDLFTLVVILHTHVQIEVPSLSKATIDAIFEAHASFAESDSQSAKESSFIEGPLSFTLPLKADGPIDSFGFAMQHNLEQANLPPIPPDVLKKITEITRAFHLDEIPFEAQENCNCLHCQIVRAISSQASAPTEEVVQDAELKFCDWDIEQTKEKVYRVTSRLDPSEYYDVYLGTPVSCTCGSNTCEHIRNALLH